jgi:hypothetical protein
VLFRDERKSVQESREMINVKFGAVLICGIRWRILSKMAYGGLHSKDLR